VSVFFTADLHLNHAGIMRHCTRPYRTVGEMNAALVELWNGAVTRESDVVWFLGDFGYHAPAGEDLGVLFWKLRGKKHLVVGNHDVKNPQVMRLPWERVEHLVELKDHGRRATLCHYPLESWPGSHHGSLMLHGHCHGTLRHVIPHRFDVGVDVRQQPVEWDRLVEEAAAQVFVPVDHHGEKDWCTCNPRHECEGHRA